MAQSPDQIAARWAQNLGASGEKIKDGVMGVTVAPGQAAAAQRNVYLQNVQANVDKWATRTAAVSKEEWQAAMVDKGLARIGAGATAAQPKFQNFIGQLLPHIDSVKRNLPPRGNLDANIQRMVTFTRGMSTFKYRR